MNWNRNLESAVGCSSSLEILCSKSSGGGLLFDSPWTMGDPSPWAMGDQSPSTGGLGGWGVNIFLEYLSPK